MAQKKQSKNEKLNEDNRTKIIAAIITAVAAILTVIITGSFNYVQSQVPIKATLTAKADEAAILTQTATLQPGLIATVTSTEIVPQIVDKSPTATTSPGPAHQCPRR